MNDKEMTKEEAAQKLLEGARIMLERCCDSQGALACLIGAKALVKAGVHKRRNHASRVRRGLPPFCQGPAKTAPGCQALATDEPTQPTT
ncbi:MAG: hypothetical protein IJS32_06775 [Kiritimatiellae bacterium]|nr:hypothetical protein [Kiritimatiellia bacterium]